MKGRALIVFVVLALGLSSLGCVCGGIDLGTMRIAGVSGINGSGKVVEEERQASHFTGVALGGTGDLTIEVGEEESLRIEAEDNLLEYIETEVRDGTLRIRTRNRINLKPKRPIHYYLKVKDLDTIVLSGMGDITAQGLEANRFAVRISGMGNVEIEELNANRLDVIISGMGDLEIAGGHVGEQDIIISGVGAFQAGQVRSEKVEIVTSGVGNATVWPIETLDVQISGSGSVNYYGNPRIDFSRSGSGALNSLGNHKGVE